MKLVFDSIARRRLWRWGAVLGLFALLGALLILFTTTWAQSPRAAGRLALSNRGAAELQPAANFANYRPAGGGGRSNPPVVVNLRDVPVAVTDSALPTRGGKRIEGHLSDQAQDAAVAAALRIPPNVAPQTASASVPVLDTAWAALDIGDCCAGTGYSAVVPPDPDIAVGEDHVVVAVNLAFAVYDKNGALAAGPFSFPNFWKKNNVIQCNGIAAGDFFDPFVAYDPVAKRYLIGIDAYHDVTPKATRFCIAVSQTNDPTGNWYLYWFNANDGKSSSWADYPHSGVWHDALYVSNNYFAMSGNAYTGARVYALDKAAMYAGVAASYAYHDTPLGGDGTPWDTLQPAKPGWDGAPFSGPQYFVSAAWCASPSSCNNLGLFSWNDPFGTNAFALVGQAPVATYYMPVSAAQKGSAGTIQTNDWRALDNQWAPDGTLYTAHAIGCNPGGGTVACVQWAQLSTAGATLQQGIRASSGTHRYFPDLAVDKFGNVLLGYTRSSSTLYPQVVLTGRLATDAPNTLGGEVLAKDGDLTYSAFDGSPYRWGDYTGLVIDPTNGCDAYYVGEYSKNAGVSARWGTWVQNTMLGQCASSGSNTEDDTDADVQYDGWRAVGDASANDGAYRMSNVQNNTATFKFKSKSLKWVTRKGADQGKAQVTIDGVGKGTFDLYAAAPQSFTQTFSGLSLTTHTIVIKVLGAKNALASDTNVSVDAFIAGSATTQENSRALQYNTWKGAGNVNASGGGYRWSNVNGATATFTFTGTTVKWVTLTGPAYGEAQVLIDGVSQGVVDLYSPTLQWQVLETYPGLVAGAHALQIRVLGTKNAASNGTRVVVDAFQVTP